MKIFILKPTLAMAMLIALSACITSENEPKLEQDSSLKAALDSQPSDTQARYSARHPQQTLSFFGIKHTNACMSGHLKLL